MIGKASALAAALPVALRPSHNVSGNASAAVTPTAFQYPNGWPMRA